MVMMMLMRHMAVLMFMFVVMMMFMLVLMLVVMMMFVFVLMLVVMMMFVFVLMAMHYSIAVAMQKGHIMVMISMLLVQNNIKIAAVNACLRHSADFILKALCRNTLQSLIKYLLIRAQI